MLTAWRVSVPLTRRAGRQRGRTREREKTCQRWLITLQANRWVLCLHLDSQGSIINQFFLLHATHTHTHSHKFINSHQSCFWFDTERTVFLIIKEYAVMNPNKERLQIWLIITLRGFWKLTQGCKAAVKVILPKSFVNNRSHKISYRVWFGD